MPKISCSRTAIRKFKIFTIVRSIKSKSKLSTSTIVSSTVIVRMSRSIVLLTFIRHFPRLNKNYKALMAPYLINTYISTWIL